MQWTSEYDVSKDQWIHKKTQKKEIPVVLWRRIVKFCLSVVSGKQKSNWGRHWRDKKWQMLKQRYLNHEIKFNYATVCIQSCACLSLSLPVHVASSQFGKTNKNAAVIHKSSQMDFCTSNWHRQWSQHTESKSPGRPFLLSHLDLFYNTMSTAGLTLSKCLLIFNPSSKYIKTLLLLLLLLMHNEAS